MILDSAPPSSAAASTMAPSSSPAAAAATDPDGECAIAFSSPSLALCAALWGCGSQKYPFGLSISVRVVMSLEPAQQRNQP